MVMHLCTYIWHALLSGNLAISPIGPSSTFLAMLIGEFHDHSVTELPAFLVAQFYFKVHCCLPLRWAQFPNDGIQVDRLPSSWVLSRPKSTIRHFNCWVHESLARNRGSLK